MAITSIAEFWSDQETRAKAAVTAARQRVADVRTTMSTARDGLAAATRAVADLQKETARIRAALAAATSPVEVHALEPALAQVIRDTRAAQADTLEQEAALQVARAALDHANEAAVAAAARLTAASAAAQTAAQQAKDRTAIVTSLGVPPLDALEADAAAALTSPPWTDAVARLDADLPKELRDASAASARIVRGQLDNDRTRAAELAKLSAGFTAASESARGAFQAADASLRDYALNAKARFDQVQAVAARVADTGQNALSEVERRAVHSLKADGSVDTALRDRRVEAADKHAALADAQFDLDAKAVRLEIARAKARAIDIDKDPETDAAVMAARQDVTDATAARDDAAAEFTSAMRTDLADWRLAVPDRTWRTFADFDEARRTLDALKDDHTPLTTRLTQAETDLVTTLVAADKVVRTADAVDAAATLATVQKHANAAVATRRLLGALRGDE